jgi:hypothetical protein
MNINMFVWYNILQHFISSGQWSISWKLFLKIIYSYFSFLNLISLSKRCLWFCRDFKMENIVLQDERKEQIKIVGKKRMYVHTRTSTCRETKNVMVVGDCNRHQLNHVDRHVFRKNCNNNVSIRIMLESINFQTWKQTNIRTQNYTYNKIYIAIYIAIYPCKYMGKARLFLITFDCYSKFDPR